MNFKALPVADISMSSVDDDNTVQIPLALSISLPCFIVSVSLSLTLPPPSCLARFALSAGFLCFVILSAGATQLALANLFYSFLRGECFFCEFVLGALIDTDR